ncbi:SCP2 sterol-binding domain-containing protein [Nitrincola iocasae]|uniref:SCP2 sterol-binding domain-containing protein n=1 Tax=Nitrincola iocasae TaxID=2614693 RepID=A0A5J6LJ33_9GAMM|nr:SCP2 sterol-binding domain-containing protein [Nitrincola iocasae]
MTLDKIVDKLPAKFNPEQAEGLKAIYQFRIADAACFYLTIANSLCNSCYGDHPDPDITLLMDEATLIRVISGEQDGMSAFMKGQLRAEGNVMLATRLGKLFSR